jgi:hypothetical protein
MNKIILVSLFAFVSCAPQIKNFSAFQKRPILKSNFVKKEDIKKGVPSVVVLDFNNKKNMEAERANLGNALAVTTENFLAASKIVKIKDRKAYKQLEKEIMLKELEGDSPVSKISSVDYAVSGDVATAGFVSEFKAARRYFDIKNKTYTSLPAQNIYKANFTGNLKIYKLPSLDVVEVIPLFGKRKEVENAIVSGGFLGIGGRVDSGAIKKSDNNLIRKAAIRSLEKKKTVLKNIFSSYRKFYILEKREFKNKSIFKINAGHDHGMKNGQKVEIFAKERFVNSLTDEETIDEMKIADGIVTNLIQKRSSWVIVKNADEAKKIKLGNFLTTKFKASFADKIKLYAN